MKNKVFYLVALAVGMVFVLGGCKDDDNDCFDETNPDCLNYNPCTGQEEFKPYFQMMYGIHHWSGVDFTIPSGFFRGPPYILIEGDTLMTNYVYFRAPREYDSVWWRIGAEGSFRHGKDVTLDFDRLYPSNLPIVMIGKRKPNKACFPNEQAIDTVRRFLTLKPNTDTKVTGQWIGAYDTHPNDSFEINIRFPKGDTYAVTIDYFPNRDLPPNFDGSPTQGYSNHVTLDKFWSRSGLYASLSADRYGRIYRPAHIKGEVYGNNYQHLKIDLNYYYDSGSSKEQQPLTFNARRK